MNLKRHRFDLTQAIEIPNLLPVPMKDDVIRLQQYHSATQDLKECIAQSELLQKLHLINDFPFFKALHDASIIRYTSLFMSRGTRGDITLDNSIFVDPDLRSFHEMVSQYRHNMLAHYGDQKHMQQTFGIQNDDRIFVDVDETDEGINDRIMPLYNRGAAIPLDALWKLRAIYGLAHDYLDFEKRKLFIRLLSGLRALGYDKLKNETSITPKPPFDSILR